jgi:hypothetical protein
MPPSSSEPPSLAQANNHSNNNSRGSVDKKEREGEEGEEEEEGKEDGPTAASENGPLHDAFLAFYRAILLDRCAIVLCGLKDLNSRTCE